jgi:hypothetical protein
VLPLGQLAEPAPAPAEPDILETLIQRLSLFVPTSTGPQSFRPNLVPTPEAK